ncbi:sigma-70 family RNA polymerase sigma factor [Candidatus Wolfebacteria bacterium]|nr:sigma-70 family RNA polymerase sigma factor [Candidatus Wolfebacteria bacterium]
MLDGEKNLIKHAIKGEAQAFGLLYDHYQPQIYRFIYLKVGLREEAEDLTHQVFLQGFEKIIEYRFEGFPFSSWLYRIARNEIIDYYRTKKIHIDLEEVVNNELEETGDDDLSKIIDQNLDLARVEEALRCLNQIEQDIVILRFVEELSPDEVARILEKKPENVRLLQHRAIQKLKKTLNVKTEA